MGSFLKQRCQSNYFVTLFTPGISQLWTRINYSWNIFQIIIISHYFIYWQLQKWFNKPVPFLYGHLLIQPYFNWFNCISEVYYKTFFFPWDCLLCWTLSFVFSTFQFQTRKQKDEQFDIQHVLSASRAVSLKETCTFCVLLVCPNLPFITQISETMQIAALAPIKPLLI